MKQFDNDIYQLTLHCSTLSFTGLWFLPSQATVSSMKLASLFSLSPSDSSWTDNVSLFGFESTLSAWNSSKCNSSNSLVLKSTLQLSQIFVPNEWSTNDAVEVLTKSVWCSWSQLCGIRQSTKSVSNEHSTQPNRLFVPLWKCFVNRHTWVSFNLYFRVICDCNIRSTLSNSHRKRFNASNNVLHVLQTMSASSISTSKYLLMKSYSTLYNGMPRYNVIVSNILYVSDVTKSQMKHDIFSNDFEETWRSRDRSDTKM